MNPKEILVIARDAESDQLAAQIIRLLREELPWNEAGYVPEVQPLQASLAPRFYGVGGGAMKAAGAELLGDGQTANFDDIHQLALEREPDVILCVGENPLYNRLAHSLKQYVQKRSGTFCNWEATILLVDLAGPSSGESSHQDDFDAVIKRREGEAPATMAHTTAQRIIAILQQRRLKQFPLKAALAP